MIPYTVHKALHVPLDAQHTPEVADFQSKYTQLVVGLSLDINVTVTVQNLGEDSYNSRAVISYPIGLSYRRVSLMQSNRHPMTVLCSSSDGSRLVICSVNKPLLKPNSTVMFVVSFHVSPLAVLGDILSMPVNITSDNGEPHRDSMTSRADIRVLYGIYVTVSSLEMSTKYRNFSSSGTERDPSRTRSVKHLYRVINLGQRSLPLSVIFMVPVKLKETPVWEEVDVQGSEPQLINCNNTGERVGPENYQERLKTRPVLDCTVATCVSVVCRIGVLDIQKSAEFSITGFVPGDWITKIQQQKVSLQSSAEIVYDPTIYHHILEQNERFVKAQTQTVLELYAEYDYMRVIVGSSLGGLVLLTLLIAGLYKLGFFRRQYKELMEMSGGESAGPSVTTTDLKTPEDQETPGPTHE
ncbi:integrin alpha-X-like [Discoglossus pictus]